MNISVIKNAVRYIKKYGIRTFFIRVSEKAARDDAWYQQWFLKNKASEQTLQRQREESGLWHQRPLVSIVTPLYRTPEKFLRELLESVLASSYDNWELCLADASDGESDEIGKIVRAYQKKDEKKRIHYRKLSKNSGIAENTNAAAEMAKGAYLAFLDHDDVLTPDALYEMVNAVGKNGVSADNAVLVYSDEDKTNGDGTAFFEPHFKPDFNPDMLCANNYITHFLMVSRILFEKTGKIRKEFDGAQDYDFILRCCENADKIVHVPKVLYHWRVHTKSTSGGGGSKDYAVEAGARAVSEHLKRIGENARVTPLPYFGFYRLKYESRELPAAAVVKKGEKLPEKISEEFVIFMDDALKPLTKDWENLLLADCSRKNVGVVGAKIYDRNRRVLEAGITREIKYPGGTEWENSYCGLKAGYGGYMHRADLQRDCDSFGGYCMIVRKQILEQMKDFHTETAYPAFGREICSMAEKLGYYRMYEPAVTMVYRKKGQPQE